MFVGDWLPCALETADFDEIGRELSGRWRGPIPHHALDAGNGFRARPESDRPSGFGRPVSDLLVPAICFCARARSFSSRCPGSNTRVFPADSKTSGAEPSGPAKGQVPVVPASLLSELPFGRGAAGPPTQAGWPVSVCFPRPGECREPLSTRASRLFDAREDLRGPLGGDIAGASDDGSAPEMCCPREAISL